MPDITLPEVRLKDKLPEGLREMSLDDIQKAMPEVRLPKIDLARDARAAGKAAERATRSAEKAAAKAAARAAKRADKAAREVQRAASRSVESALPRKRGPNPVPIAILFMLGGVIVGWLLATNPAAAARVRAGLADVRARWDSFRGRGGSELPDEGWDGETRAFTESLRAPVAPAEPYVGSMPASETGVAVGPGELPEGMGTSDPARAGADERV